MKMSIKVISGDTKQQNILFFILYYICIGMLLVKTMYFYF